MSAAILGPVYIAGPMTSYPAYNFPAFHAAARHLREQGVEVVNPAELDEADSVKLGGRAWDEYVRRDLRELARCNSVAVLRGWQRSRGASLEVHVARALGMAVYDADTLEPYRETVLQEAQRVVDGDRGEAYGHPSVNHGCTAALVEAYLSRRYGSARFDALDVCMVNVLQKVSRLANTPGHRDSLVDIAGYARNAEMLTDPGG
ncbi:MAG: DUF4406 domain-containing protein [Phycisphaerales bacterium]|jgi:hypothetical protein